MTAHLLCEPNVIPLGNLGVKDTFKATWRQLKATWRMTRQRFTTWGDCELHVKVDGLCVAERPLVDGFSVTVHVHPGIHTVEIERVRADGVQESKSFDVAFPEAGEYTVRLYLKEAMKKGVFLGMERSMEQSTITVRRYAPATVLTAPHVSPAGAVAPHMQPSGSATAAPLRLKAHRGGLIQGLGIGSCFLPFPLLIITLALASSDIREMADGRMDPDGMAATRSGRKMALCSAVFYGLILAAAIYSTCRRLMR